MTDCTPPIEPSRIGVVGGGTMGVGITYVCATGGHDVTVVEPGADRRSELARTIRSTLATGVARGRFTESAAEQSEQRVSVVDSIDLLPREADLVIESVPEQLDVKRRVLGELAALSPCLIATNTSAISIDLLAESVSDPTCFLGMHFFNPVWSLHLVELVRGAATSSDTLATAEKFVASIGKQSIVVADIPGFATSRLDMGAALEAMRMLEDGVSSAEDIDRAAVLAYRHPVGPLELSDIVGLDVRLDIARTLATSHGSRFEPPQILIDKVAAGHLGQKTGRGFHDWPRETTHTTERPET